MSNESGEQNIYSGIFWALRYGISLFNRRYPKNEATVSIVTTRTHVIVFYFLSFLFLMQRTHKYSQHR